MAQTNAVQDQPSMEDILASIRRIIDDGNKKPAPAVPDEINIANDDDVAAAAAVESQPAAPRESVAASPVVSDEIGIPELDSFLESLDAKHSAQEVPAEPAASAKAEKSNVVSIDVVEPAAKEPVIIEAAAPREASKYEARFSDTDRSAFAQVGSALSNSTKEKEPDSQSLVSDNTRSAIGLSLEDLSAALMKEAGHNLPELTQQMLRPMLSDWLDNNLPSMVERLVRSEIERIARGD